MSQWHIGQKVVCIEDGIGAYHYRHPNGLVRAGVIYTIVGIRPFLPWDGLELLECPVRDLSGRETGWDASKFRPLAEADLSAELAETFLKGQPPSEQEVCNPQYT